MTSQPPIDAAAPADRDELHFSLVRGGPLYRLQRALGLIPDEGLGIGRRFAALLLLAWLPVMLLAALDRRLFPGISSDPLLRHFGVHVRCLVAFPMFLIGEALVEQLLPVLIGYFAASGLVDEQLRPRFSAALRSVERLRDSWLALVVILLLLGFAMGYAVEHPLAVHEVTWALTDDMGQPRLGAAGAWYLLITRPLFTLMLAHWLWRVCILGVLFRRIAALDLHLVATHPDQAGGLGFLENAATMFAPVVFGIAAVVAAGEGHQVLYHDVHVDSLYLPVGVFAVLSVAIFISPLLAFSAPLRRLKRRALLEYGALVGRQGRLVGRRWIGGETVDSDLLDAPEIGPVADAITMYDAVGNIRPTPFRKGPVLLIAAAALLPMLPVAAIEVPIKALLQGLLKTLV